MKFDQPNAPSVCVTGNRRAADLLSSTNTRPLIGAVVSICDATGSALRDEGYKRPHGLITVPPPNKLLLRFDDVDSPLSAYQAVTKAEIQSLIDFYRRAALPFFAGTAQTKLVIHCAAGISRSTAACLIGYALVFGKERISQASDSMENATEHTDPWPNRLMLRHADEILGFDGKLEKAGR